MKSRVDIAVNWIRKKVKEANAKGAILGLSGGLDSAVVGSLVKKAVGKNHLALVMPCNAVKGAVKDAELVAKHFNLKNKIIDLAPIFNAFMKILPKGNSLALANIKPRMRMLILYYFANNLDYLVVGTGNKSELSVGYFTKYGDGGVDILPIGDLLKSQVKELAEELGVPKKIIDKVPSADLWPGQTDEGEMGIFYHELDKILVCFSLNKESGFPLEKVNKVKKMAAVSKHKRCTPEILQFKA